MPKSILYLHHVLITELLIIIIPWSVMFNLYIHNQSLLPSDYFEVNNRYHIILSVYNLICIFK